MINVLPQTLCNNEIKNDGSCIVIPSQMNALNRQDEVAVAVSALKKMDSLIIYNMMFNI